MLRAEVGKVIVGLSEIVEDTLTALIAGGHVLLEGVPGPGQDAAGPHAGRRPAASSSSASSSRPT